MPQPQQQSGSDELVLSSRRNRTRMALAIVAAGVVLLGGLAFAVTGTSGTAADPGAAPGSGPGEPFPRSEYRLTEPKALMNGEYEIYDGLGAMVDEAHHLSSDPDFRNPHGVGGQYTATDGRTLTVTGAWGQIRDPDENRDRMLRGPAEAEGTAVLVPARDMTPAGAPVKVGCQVLAYPHTDSPAPFAMCVWADGNTTASVELMTPGLRKPEDFDLAVVAGLTLDIRAEIRQPIGSQEQSS